MTTQKLSKFEFRKISENKLRKITGGVGYTYWNGSTTITDTIDDRSCTTHHVGNSTYPAGTEICDSATTNCE
jgi:hypothetical protein